MSALFGVSSINTWKVEGVRSWRNAGEMEDQKGKVSKNVNPAR